MESVSNSDASHRCQFRIYLGVDMSPAAGHTGSIQTLIDDHDIIYTGSRDATIKEWAHRDIDRHRDNNDHLIQSSSSSSSNGYHCLGTYRGHTDWITSLLVYQHQLISASCDRSIRFWDRRTGQCLCTARSHIDYIECIDIDPNTERLISAGLDNQLYIWDMKYMSSPISQLHQVEHCASIYSICVDSNLVITGSSDKVIRIWDSRTASVIDRLSGHQGNIRDLFIRNKSLISASSDGTVRVWDISRRRSIAVYSPLTKEPVWSVSGDRNLNYIYAGGRSDQISCIDLCKGQTSLVGTSHIPDLYCNRLYLDKTQTCIYIATSDTNLTCIDVSSLHSNEHDIGASLSTGPDLDNHQSKQHQQYQLNLNRISSCCKPVVYACPPCRNTNLDIAGRPAVVSAIVLRDGRRVCTQNSIGEIAIWDVVEQKQLASLGTKSTLFEIQNRYDTEVSVPSWFTIDLHLGALGIVLQKSTVFCAEIWSQPIVGSRPTQIKLGLHKINLGAMALEHALQIWITILSKKRSATLSGDVNQNLIRVTESPQSSPVDGPKPPAEVGPDQNVQAPLPEPDEPVPSPKHALGIRVGDFETELDCLIVTQQLIGASSALFRILNLYDPNEFDEIVTPWVRAWIVEGVMPTLRRCELRFEVRPYPDEKPLPALPTGTWMKADEAVTIRHVSAYIIQQLPVLSRKMESDQSRCDPDRPEDILSIVVDDQVLGPLTSLRTARALAWKNKKTPFMLLYRSNI